MDLRKIWKLVVSNLFFAILATSMVVVYIALVLVAGSVFGTWIIWAATFVVVICITVFMSMAEVDCAKVQDSKDKD